MGIIWKSPLDIVPCVARHYLVANGENAIPTIVSGANLLPGLDTVFQIAELPNAPTCEEGEDGLH